MTTGYGDFPGHYWWQPTVPPNYPYTAPGYQWNSPTIQTTWTAPGQEQECWTWAEALMVALRAGSTRKPRVFRRGEKWVVTLYPYLVSYNETA